MPLRTIIAVLFIEGFAGLTLQMLYLRQLSTEFGSNIVVTSWVISIFLLALAFGYERGRFRRYNYFSKNESPEKYDVGKHIARNFLIAAIVATVGLSHMTMDAISNHVLQVMSMQMVLCLYSLIIIAPVSYFLGQTLPLLSEEVKHSTASEASGRVLFLSTIGSFLGGLLSPLLLMQYAGVSATLLTAVILLLLCVACLSRKLAIVSLAGAIAAYFFIVPYAQDTRLHTNRYNDYDVKEAVIEGKEMKVFSLNNSWSSVMEKDSGRPHGYLKFLRDSLWRFYPEGGDVLVLGAGGFVISHTMNGENYHFQYVDIDPQVKELAEESFLDGPINGEFSDEGAIAFLNKNDKQYDTIILDAYSSARGIPNHLSSVEFFNSLKKHVKDDGMLMINFITSFRFDSEYSRRSHHALTEAWPYCRSIMMDAENYLNNIVYLCFNRQDDGFYTQDKGEPSLDYANQIESAYDKMRAYQEAQKESKP